MITMFTINLMMTVIFIMMNHPLSMGLILLAQTVLVSLITGNYNYNFWFSYILFLILIGGMLILFMYMTSIASNEKFKFNLMSLLPMTMIPIIVMLLDLNWNLWINTLNNEMLQFHLNNTINLSLNKYINLPSNTILTFMIMYLFLTLVATVKITEIKQGPLRQMN